MAIEAGKAGQQLTERQKKWFATVRANLEAKTGRSLEQWVSIATAGCAGLGPRAQAAWLKDQHGVGANHAAYILSEAFPSRGWEDPDALRKALWKDTASHRLLEAVEAAVADIDGLVQGQRKTYTAWSRQVQFAAMRPLPGGRALLGLKLEPDASARLSAPTRKESWSERLSAVVELSDPAQVDAELVSLFRAAAERG